MMLAGVCIQTRICRASATVIAVTINPIAAESQTLLATYLRRFSSSCAPKRCAIGMANPAQEPMQKPKIRNCSEPTEPTAASASTPRY